MCRSSSIAVITSHAVERDEQAVRRLVAGLPLPASFHCSVRSDDPAPHCGSNPAGTERFSPARMRRFRRGRACAAGAMAELGVDGAELPIGVDRAPVWPNEVVGSITHSANVSVAVVTRSCHASAIGIDLETSRALPRYSVERVAVACELDGVRIADADDGVLLFSAKESIFKCLSRFVEQFIDFSDVAIAFDTDSMMFGIRWSAISEIQAMRNEVSGYYRVEAGRVMTLAIRGKAS